MSWIHLALVPQDLAVETKLFEEPAMIRADERRAQPSASSSRRRSIPHRAYGYFSRAEWRIRHPAIGFRATAPAGQSCDRHGFTRLDASRQSSPARVHVS